MKKIYCSLLFVILFTSSLMADNRAWYVGLGVQSGSGTHEDTFRGSSDSVDVDSDLIQFKIGRDTGSSRFEIAYTSNDVEDEKFYGFDFDYVQPFTAYMVKPFFTLGLGLHSWEDFEGYDSSTDDTRERKAMSFNYGIGALYKIKMIELELAYKGKYYSWEDMTILGQDLESTTKTHGIYLGANFRF